MESSETPRTSAAADLALVGQTRAGLLPPRGFALAYDSLFSVMCGAFVAGQALPLIPRISLTVGVLLAAVGLITWWRNRMGWWLSGYSPRGARWASIVLVVVLTGLAFWVIAVPELSTSITAGVAATIAAFAASRFWARVWRRKNAGGRSTT
ncbi:hypothetical protein [Microbacterium gorillae]|uniref:hypothetical protein n=1 Tax=Microbacterium gorillae TaxID=1231063 RepID=UPI003D9606AD